MLLDMSSGTVYQPQGTGTTNRFEAFCIFSSTWHNLADRGGVGCAKRALAMFLHVISTPRHAQLTDVCLEEDHG